MELTVVIALALSAAAASTLWLSARQLRSARSLAGERRRLVEHVEASQRELVRAASELRDAVGERDGQPAPTLIVHRPKVRKLNSPGKPQVREHGSDMVALEILHEMLRVELVSTAVKYGPKASYSDVLGRGFGLAIEHATKVGVLTTDKSDELKKWAADTVAVEAAHPATSAVVAVGNRTTHVQQWIAGVRTTSAHQVRVAEAGDDRGKDSARDERSGATWSA